MQDKPTTVAAYAAGASLAAVALFYVFGPNYTIDGEETSGSYNRKKSIVGLSNPANDCFINSVLQALAGLGDLRVYVIRELHRRQLDGPEIYSMLPGLDEIPRGERPDKIRELQQGTITRALKEMLDRLNERPIYKKTISASSFLHSLEYAFRMRISRNQQDAQEFLQIVLERLCEEYHAGVKSRQRAERFLETPAGSGFQEPSPGGNGVNGLDEAEVRFDDGTDNGLPAMINTKLKEIDNEYGFPFEGKLQSQIECQTCHYQYKPNQTSFVNLTVQVPQRSSTTLSACFDGLLKTEYIEDFRCDNCRLLHALEIKTRERARSRSETERERLELEIQTIQTAIETDPEVIPPEVKLPPTEAAPKRRIARHMRITVFPKIIAIHLSRSIFDHSSSTKNAAKVSFPERLSLGGILSPKWFKLLAIVCHKGSHQSGHYESFRRNTLYPAFSTPGTFSSYAQSRATSANPSQAPSPHLGPRRADSESSDVANLSRSASAVSLSGNRDGHVLPPPVKESLQLNPPPSPSTRPTTAPSRISFQSNRSKSSKTTFSPTSDGTNSPSTEGDRWSKFSSRPSTGISWSSGDKGNRLRRRRKANNRWWRISDEKIKECKTSDVLGMQKEVYLLFYEMEKPDTGTGVLND